MNFRWGLGGIKIPIIMFVYLKISIISYKQNKYSYSVEDNLMNLFTDAFCPRSPGRLDHNLTG